MSSHIQSSSTSEHATPTGHLIPLPQSLNNSNPHSEFIPQDEDTPPAENDVSQRREMGYDIPHSWRKPSLSMSRNDLIVVVQRAVNFLLTIPGALTQSQYYSSRLACVVIDNHLGVRSYKHLMPSSYYVSDLQYENLLIGIMNTRHYSTYEDCGPLPDAIRRWKVIAEE
ncbi:hypothetical protein FRC02_005242 [Tulasnella sp. 418]|nr:hypothetical protein FRC02_005242 [Tulasnella sp. 418]